LSPASYNHLSDSELIALYKLDSNKQAFGILFNRYTHLVFGVCLKYLKDRDDAEDAVMQIFEKLLTDIIKHDVQEFKFWIHTVAKNHCLMQLRKEQHARKHQNQLDKDAISLMDFTEDAHHDRNEIKEIQLNEMNLALKQLNDTQRRCIELFYIQDKSYQQIALETGFTLNEVRSYIQNGKRNLKIHLEKIRERK
jgi:RNA polymerase sigma-70 factor (ECF subfamily)